MLSTYEFNWGVHWSGSLIRYFFLEFCFDLNFQLAELGVRRQTIANDRFWVNTWIFDKSRNKLLFLVGARSLSKNWSRKILCILILAIFLLIKLSFSLVSTVRLGLFVEISYGLLLECWLRSIVWVLILRENSHCNQFLHIPGSNIIFHLICVHWYR